MRIAAFICSAPGSLGPLYMMENKIIEEIIHDGMLGMVKEAISFCMKGKSRLTFVKPVQYSLVHKEPVYLKELFIEGDTLMTVQTRNDDVRMLPLDMATSKPFQRSYNIIKSLEREEYVVS